MIKRVKKNVDAINEFIPFAEAVATSKSGDRGKFNLGWTTAFHNEMDRLCFEAGIRATGEYLGKTLPERV